MSEVMRPHKATQSRCQGLVLCFFILMYLFGNLVILWSKTMLYLFDGCVINQSHWFILEHKAKQSNCQRLIKSKACFTWLLTVEVTISNERKVNRMLHKLNRLPRKCLWSKKRIYTFDLRAWRTRSASPMSPPSSVTSTLSQKITWRRFWIIVRIGFFF